MNSWRRAVLTHPAPVPLSKADESRPVQRWRAIAKVDGSILPVLVAVAEEETAIPKIEHECLARMWSTSAFAFQGFWTAVGAGWPAKWWICGKARERPTLTRR